MVNLRTQKRLAASVIGCGKRKIWLDPNEVNEISNANSRQTIRKLVSDGLIIRKPVTMHSRSRARELNLARRIGRHRGFDKSCGCAVSESSAVSWSSTAPAARSTSTSTTSSTTPARVTPSSTSAHSSSTSTVPRPRRPASGLSRRKWTPSDSATRLPASASRRDRRPSATRWRVRSRHEGTRVTRQHMHMTRRVIWKPGTETAAFGVHGWVSSFIPPSVVMRSTGGLCMYGIDNKESMIWTPAAYYRVPTERSIRSYLVTLAMSYCAVTLSSGT
ncbi:ribosomal protein L19/L19e domain-containing protein [Xylariaceae sp. FL0804]|nr:ribosomal protein L19/L19e domain-containing protein [Xylariaceae sp. FL0804]